MPQTHTGPAPRPRAPGHVLRRGYGISRTTWWRWRQDPRFPAPAVIGQVQLFDVEAVERWLDAHTQRREAAS